jgi:diguanylate cyclase (GGDEF)-like protein
VKVLYLELAGYGEGVKVLTRAATSSLGALGLWLVVVVVILATVGVTGIRASERFGNSAASYELTTSTATGQLAWDMDMAYATGEEAFLTPGAARRSQLLGSLYASLLPAVDAQLGYLQRLHVGDPPGEHAKLGRFVSLWIAVRNLLSPVNVSPHPAPVLAARLAAAYQPVGTGLGQLLTREQLDGHTNQVAADANTVRSIGFVSGAAAAGVVFGALLLMLGIRRVRRSMEPSQAQAEFADILQVANDEEEAHQLLRHHLERTLAGTTVVILNRNNSADRLEAVTLLASDSPLAETLRGAEPRSCLAVRSGRTHRASDTEPALLACPVCAVCPGASACVPLTVGGEVIGSVLLNRAARYTEAEEQRIHESVRQSAPVLANLRNLAVAEIRAATDGLTGLPNKRAVTDTLKRMFAQASTTGSPLALLLLDLDHFKQINDQRGHAVGDQVLANVGAVLRSVLRARDFAGRNGGEEFAVLLPDTDVSAATEIAERIRQAISEISVPGTDVSVTTSIGVGGFPRHVSTLDRLERLTDAALYLAKRHGRNQVEQAEPAALDAMTDLMGPSVYDLGPVPVPVPSRPSDL